MRSEIQRKTAGQIHTKEHSNGMNSNSEKTLKVLYGNVCSLLNKLNELSAYVVDAKPDIIAICETWGYPVLNNSFFNIPGFEIVCRNDRLDTTRGVGGGLLMYVRHDLTNYVVNLSSTQTKDFVQVCWNGNLSGR